MQRIIVKNFGPLKDIDLEIKDFMVIIGPNASGKSTLMRLISLLNRAIEDFIFENSSDKIIPNIKGYFDSQLDTTFPDHIDYYIKFFLNQDVYVEIDYSKNERNYRYSREIEEISNYQPSEIIKSASDSITFIYDDEVKYKSFVKSRIGSQFFGGKLLIPDNRRVIYNNPEYFAWQSNSSIEEKVFFNNFNSYFKFFNGEGIDLNFNKSNNPNKEIFLQIKSEILKGKISSFERGALKGISLQSGKLISIDRASSGQQEALPVIIILARAFYGEQHNLLFIEEPEAHLYPESQRELLKLIALFYNAKIENRVFINTHSHYIIGTLNVLINAFRLGQEYPEEVNKVIPKEFWIDKERVYVGYLKDGEIRNIYDKEAEMYEIEDLTYVASILNKEFDDLLEIEFQNEEA